MIRVFLVEDDPHWVSLLELLLTREQDIQLIGVASSRSAALEQIKDIQVDVVLMDVHLVDEHAAGIVTAATLSRHNQTSIVMLSSDDSSDTVTRSFAAGAVNYVSKSNIHLLAETIRQAASEQELPLDALRKEYLRLRREEMLRELTVTEREIFELHESGLTMVQIQEQLYKEKSTLKSHINRILRKIGARNMNDAIEKVRQLGI